MAQDNPKYKNPSLSNSLRKLQSKQSRASKPKISNYAILNKS